MSAPTAETGWQKLSQTQATCTRLVAASILYKSSRLGPFTPTWIRIASTTTSRTEMHSCKFAWLPPYNDMQNVPKRRQSSCSHYRSVCHCTRRSHPLTRARNTSTVPHSELIHTRQARQRRATRTPHEIFAIRFPENTCRYFCVSPSDPTCSPSTLLGVSRQCKLTLQ